MNFQGITRAHDSDRAQPPTDSLLSGEGGNRSRTCRRCKISEFEIGPSRCLLGLVLRHRDCVQRAWRLAKVRSCLHLSRIPQTSFEPSLQDCVQHERGKRGDCFRPVALLMCVMMAQAKSIEIDVPSSKPTVSDDVAWVSRLQTCSEVVAWSRQTPLLWKATYVLVLLAGVVYGAFDPDCLVPRS